MYDTAAYGTLTMSISGKTSIKGESQLAWAKDELIVVSPLHLGLDYVQTASHSNSPGNSSTGRAIMQDMAVEVLTDSSLAPLMTALASQTHFDKVVLTAWAKENDQKSAKPMIQVTLEQATFRHVGPNLQPAGTSTTTILIAFAKMTLAYTGQTNAGDAAAPKDFIYDQATGI